MGAAAVHVLVGVLHQRAVVEQDEEGEAAQPCLQTRVPIHGVEVGPVAAAVQPERLELALVAQPPRLRRFYAAAAFQHREEEGVVVAEHSAAVGSLPSQPSRRRTTAVTRWTYVSDRETDAT